MRLLCVLIAKTVVHLRKCSSFKVRYVAWKIQRLKTCVRAAAVKRATSGSPAIGSPPLVATLKSHQKDQTCMNYFTILVE